MNGYRWIAVAGIAGVIIAGCNQPTANKPTSVVNVLAARPVVKTIPIFLEENGETEAVEQAMVRARVRGILEEIRFEPDSIVVKGTPLFTIEQKEYKAEFQSCAIIPINFTVALPLGMAIICRLAGRETSIVSPRSTSKCSGAKTRYSIW